MQFLDTRSIILSVSITSISCSVILIVLYLKNIQFKSIIFWILGVSAIGFANLLVAFRGSIPDILSITGSNLLFMSAPVFFYLGTKKFMNLGKSSIPVISVYMFFSALFIIVFFLDYGIAFRIVIQSLEFASAFFMISLLCLFDKSEMFRRTGKFFGIINLFLAAFSFSRVVTTLLSSHSPDFFKMGDSQIFILIMFNLFIMLSTLGFFQMINDVLQFQLKNKTLELEKETRRLHEKDRRIFLELELAVKIQRKSIPDTAPADNISYIYKPMLQLGGDFFDFSFFKGSEDIGMFISDVTGHGAHAALITSMIKTSLLQSGSKRLFPAELLLYLDESLKDLTVENFITAFYGIYKPEEKKIVYSNAGHCRPYIITEKGVKPMHLDPARPLCVEFEGKRPFSTSEIILPENSKFVLYTDGLTEAMNAYDPKNLYEDNGLLDSMYDSRNFTAGEFISKVYNDLVKFRGKDSFDDDICIICLDIK
jgi:serine phosphatase RsbU (regulator of sigma subunit)